MRLANSQQYMLQQAADTERQTRGSTSSQVANAEAQLRAAQAALAQAQAQYEHQEADTSRTVALARQGVMSAQSRDEAVTSLNAAKAAVDTAQGNVGRGGSLAQGSEGEHHSGAGAGQGSGCNAQSDAQCPSPAEPGAGGTGLLSRCLADLRQGERKSGAAGRSSFARNTDRDHHRPDPDMDLRAIA